MQTETKRQMEIAEVVGSLYGLRKLASTANNQLLTAVNADGGYMEGYVPPYVTFLRDGGENLGEIFCDWPPHRGLASINDSECAGLEDLRIQLDAWRVVCLGQTDLKAARAYALASGASVEACWDDATLEQRQGEGGYDPMTDITDVSVVGYML